MPNFIACPLAHLDVLFGNRKQEETQGKGGCRRLFGNRQTQLSQAQFDKITTKETIYKYIRKFSIKVNRGRGQNFPIFISCRYLVELGPRQLGLPVAELDARKSWLSQVMLLTS